MIHYLSQILVFHLLFLVVYDLFFKKETFFKWNRLYLIVAPLLSFVLPLIKIDFIRRSIPEQFIVQLPTVLIGGSPSSATMATETLDAITIYSLSGLSNIQIWQLVWIIGIMASFGIFLLKLLRIYKLMKFGFRTEVDGLKVYNLPNTNTAFSFFKNIFLGDQLSEVQKTNILLHEKIHIKQHHSIDLLFFELLRILFWFNPLVYIFQNKMILLQEYIADAEAVGYNGKQAYYEDLLSQVFKTESISFINTFFNHSLIKKRITMLQKSKSKKIYQLKYLLLAPVIATMLVYTACTDQTPAKEFESVKNADTEVMDKINELAEAIMKKGDMTEDELMALKFLSKEYKEGDKIYTSVGEYLEEKKALAGLENIDESNMKVKVPFTEIDKVPVFPGCENMNNAEAKKCFTDMLVNFVVNEFNTKVAKSEVSGRQRIAVRFQIDRNGIVTDVDAKTNHQELKDEAIRVVKMLPKMIPGEQDGEKVSVQYALPIVFEIE